MYKIHIASVQRRDAILSAVIPIFGHFGFRKTSVDQIAEAAGLSKQGLYLHFSSKEEIFIAAMQKYLDEGLELVGIALAKPGVPLFDRLTSAMDAWFGRNLTTFTSQSYDVIEAGDRLSKDKVEQYKIAFKSKIEAALAGSQEFGKLRNVCTPSEVAEVLFLFGLTWKEVGPSRADFIDKLSLCVRVCCQLDQI